MSQRDVSDHTPQEDIPCTTPEELLQYEEASRHFWSSAECRKRAVARAAAAECDIPVEPAPPRSIFHIVK